MKKTPTILWMLCCLFTFETIAASTPAESHLSSLKKPFETIIVFGHSFSVEDFLVLTPEKYQKLTGKKLSWFQKLSLRMKQRSIKKHLQKGDINILSDFDPFGFILGLFISVVGIGITYLYDDKNMKKWAWRGAAIGGIFILIAILL